MSDKYNKTIAKIIQAIENLRVLKKEENYVTISSVVNLTGDKTGKKFEVRINIDGHNNITVDGDLPIMNVVQEAVKEYYSN